jgi:molybdopterin molybdotransferase
MLSFAEARELVVRDVHPLGHERVPLDRALGRVLGRPAIAHGPLPPTSASAMDGYAVASATMTGSGPWTYQVLGESRTGGLAPTLVPGSACRIFTGASLPAGSDAVIMQEDADRHEQMVTFRAAASPGAHVRWAGEDLASGAIALTAGTRLGPLHLSLLASLDRAEVAVHRRPRVAILCTGDELRSPGDAQRPGTLPESNSVALAALVRQAGAEATILPLVGDDAEATHAAISDALAACDVLLTVGGVSVGDHDLVRPALERAGVSLAFWKVAIKPGKPLALGARGATRVLALPGNPASAVVTLMLFGLPLLRALQGDLEPFPAMLRLPLAKKVLRKPGRLEFMRARVLVSEGIPSVEAFSNQASGAITTMAWANALALLPAEHSLLDAGALVEVLRFSDA